MLPSKSMTMWLAALVAVLAAPGCAQLPRTDLQRTGCNKGDGARVARIEILYDANGDLAAMPDKCWVKPGARVVWYSTGRAIGSSPKAVKDFRIEFREGSPDSEYRGTFDAAQAGARGHEAPLARTRDAKEGGDEANTYKYWVVVGSDELDPSIIIDM